MALFLGLLVAGVTRSAPGAELPPRLRRPVALAFTPDHQHLVVANRRGQSLSLIDVAEQKTIREVACGATLSDLKPLDDGSWMLATDESGHQLLLLRIEPDQIHVQQRIAVSPYPVRVVIDQQQQYCYVTSLWSRRVTRLRLEKSAAGWRMSGGQALDLPFSPRELRLLQDAQRLVIGDSFGGQLAVVCLLYTSDAADE